MLYYHVMIEYFPLSTAILFIYISNYIQYIKIYTKLYTVYQNIYQTMYSIYQNIYQTVYSISKYRSNKMYTLFEVENINFVDFSGFVSTLDLKKKNLAA